MWQALDFIQLVQDREQRWVVVNFVVNFHEMQRLS
jgi:hypothetical protein